MKAQISSEFMVVFSALVLIFVVVFTLYSGGSLNLFQAEGSVAAMRNANAVAAALNYAYLAGDGASYSFTPARVASDENITISDYAVSSERPHAYAAAPLLDGSINASSIGRGPVLITNNGGELDISG
ncbi:MAG: hypothetical protein PHV13_02070 [Candidatus ainarchaeum sp.]|nr:hypothetical protein [Candidatus ainarchaeum sp.]